jgi:hypothetical protein
MTKPTQTCLIFCFAALLSLTAFGQDANEVKPSPKDAQGLKEFSARVDIFTPDAAEAFVDAIAREFRGSMARNARATIQHGAPIRNVHLAVNQLYPKTLPYTSVPPTLLLKLPQLPGEVEYRIVDHDLVLLDVKANLVVDILRGALP